MLGALDEGLLGRLVAPYGAYLARRGVEFGPGAPADRARLAEALGPGDPDLPLALQHALAALVDLASPEGEAELRALAAERGVELAAAPGRSADAAALCYLEHRALFGDAHTRLGSLTMGLLVDYGAPPGRVPRPLSPAGRVALRHGGVGRDAAGADGAPCASIADAAEELVAVFERPAPPGAPPRRGPPVVAVFDKARRVLSLSTPDPDEQQRLRALFGRVLFGDEAAFAPCRGLSGAPFRELGEASLRPGGVEGLAAVRLRKLVVQTFEASHLVLGAEADDLAGALGPDGRLGPLLRLGEVVHWALEVVPVGRAPFLVELDPPNRWRLRDRRDAPLVRRFLALRGFLRAGGEPGRAAP
ncbi:MAG TPA: hypothetical protein VFS00_32310 [Polyangiaceae bacterium]|nr:hypothetical protein [Polyangiaceae bacterium]